ncbi:6387_t:CDS:2, partial [Scutellospora calospora]
MNCMHYLFDVEISTTPKQMSGSMFFGSELMHHSKICKKGNEIDKIFATITARDIQKVWQQFLVNINIPAIRDDSTISNNFEKLLTDV